MRWVHKLAEDRRFYESGESAHTCHLWNETCADYRRIWRNALASGIVTDARHFRRMRRHAQRKARDAHRRHVCLKRRYGVTSPT